jgi:N12 class adenine-specific DNA methylase/adenine-specific DNA methylase
MDSTYAQALNRPAPVAEPDYDAMYLASLDAEIAREEEKAGLELERFVDQNFPPLPDEPQPVYLLRRRDAINQLRQDEGITPLAPPQSAQDLIPRPDRSIPMEAGARLIRGQAGMVQGIGGAMQAGAQIAGGIAGPLPLAPAMGGLKAVDAVGNAIATFGENVALQLPPSPGPQYGVRNIVGSVAESAPSLAASVGAGVALAPLGPVGAVGAFALGAMPPVVGQTYREAIDAGQSPNDAAIEAAIAGGITGVTSVFPGAAILSRNPVGQGILRAATETAIGRMGAAAVAEGGQEVAESIGQEVTSMLMRPEYKAFTEQYLNSLPMDFLVGGILGGGAQAVASRRESVRKAQRAAQTAQALPGAPASPPAPAAAPVAPVAPTVPPTAQVDPQDREAIEARIAELEAELAAFQTQPLEGDANEPAGQAEPLPAPAGVADGLDPVQERDAEDGADVEAAAPVLDAGVAPVVPQQGPQAGDQPGDVAGDVAEYIRSNFDALIDPDGESIDVDMLPKRVVDFVRMEAKRRGVELNANLKRVPKAAPKPVEAPKPAPPPVAPPQPPAAPPVSAGLQASFDKLDDAMSRLDVLKIAEFLHPDNKNLRKRFTEKTGVQLPATVSKTRDAVGKWGVDEAARRATASAPAPAPAPKPANNIYVPAKFKADTKVEYVMPSGEKRRGTVVSFSETYRSYGIMRLDGSKKVDFVPEDLVTEVSRSPMPAPAPAPAPAPTPKPAPGPKVDVIESPGAALARLEPDIGKRVEWTNSVGVREVGTLKRVDYPSNYAFVQRDKDPVGNLIGIKIRMDGATTPRVIQEQSPDPAPAPAPAPETANTNSQRFEFGTKVDYTLKNGEKHRGEVVFYEYFDRIYGIKRLDGSKKVDKVPASMVAAAVFRDPAFAPDPAPAPKPAPRPAPGPAPAPAPKPSITDSLPADDKAKLEELKKRWKAKTDGSQLNTGVDPDLYTIGVQIGYYYLKAGAKKFSDFARSLVGDIGDSVKPYLQSIYNGARSLPGIDRSGLDSADMVERMTAEDIDRILQETSDGTGDIQGGVPDPQRNDVAGSAGSGQDSSQADPRVEPQVGPRGGRTEPVGRQPRSGRGDGSGRVPSVGGDVDVEEAAPSGPGSANSDTDAGERDGGGGREVRDVSADVTDHVIVDAKELAPRGNAAKLDANLRAIAILKKIEASGAPATKDQQQALAQYTGWGWAGEYFNEEKYAYKSQREKMKEAMTTEEYESARASTLNAHYTSPEVIRPMWALARRLGFQGGTVLEPAAGVGHFFGLMPRDLTEKSSRIAVELDNLSGRITKALYPNADVRVTGFENAKIANNSVDLAISNVPFGGFSLVAKDYPKLLIHDYFFARALDKVKPGGLVMFITSDGTLDKSEPKVRQLLGEKADLVGAIRLPNNAFAENAGTQVTTDIIVFRKKDGTPFVGQGFSSRQQVGTDRVKSKAGDWSIEPILVNEYYAANPKNALGRHSLQGTMYRDGDYALVSEPGQDTAKLLRDAIERFPADVMGRQTVDAGLEARSAEQGDKNESYVYRDQGWYQVQGDELVAAPWLTQKNWGDDPEKGIDRNTALKRIGIAEDWVALRDATTQLISLETSISSTPQEIEKQRAELNKMYDRYVLRHGQLNRPRQSSAAAHFLSDDPEYSLLQGLEVEKTEIKYRGKGKKKGDAYTERNYVKGPAFSERLNQPIIMPDRVETASDAIGVSMGFLGRLDIAEMAKMMGVSEEEATRQVTATGAVYENPSTGLLETKDKYLSGNVRRKLAEARQAAESDENYKPNVAALEAVQPVDKPFEKIDYKLSARWIPTEVLVAFMKDVLGTGGSIKYYPSANSYLVKPDLRATSQSDVDFGTQDITGLAIYVHALNGTEPRISHPGPDGKPVFSPDGTAAAINMLNRLKDRFMSWSRVSSTEVSKDGMVMLPRELLTKAYNETNNSMVAPEYDGSYLTLPGISKVVRRTQHQLSVVARIIQEGYAVMAHGVGSGKTYSLIMSAMEMKRLGMAKKPMIVVQKSTLGQFAASFRAAYPNARLLIADKKSFAKKNRRRLIARIALGNYDAIVVTHPQFDRMLPSERDFNRFYGEKIAELSALISESAIAEGKNSPTTKQLESAKKRLIKKLSKSVDKVKARGDDVIPWDKLNVDALLIDEAHAYKRASLVTRLVRVKGIPNDESSRAVGLQIKVSSIHQRMGEKNVVMASGTPVTNTLAEVYVMLRYAAPKALAEFSISNFDDFVNTFGKTKTDIERLPGGSYRRTTRFTHFGNGTEFTRLVRSGFDVKMGNKELGINVPDLVGDKPELVLVDQTKGNETISAWVAELIESYSRLRGRDKFKFGWVFISAMQADAWAAVDPRLIETSLPDDPNSKLSTVAKNVAKIYQETADRRATQLVFIDRFSEMSTSKLHEFLHKGPIDQALDQDDESDMEQEEVGDDEDSYSEDGDFIDEEIKALQKEEADNYKNGKLNLYKDLKNKLVAMGVKAEEIAIIHEYNSDRQREALFRDVNAGTIRVLMGSTERMGVGVNVQERLYASHNVDLPRLLTPALMEQRNGRIIRQGNLHAPKTGSQPDNWEMPVRIINYGLKRSIEETISGMLQRKSRMTEQVLMGRLEGDTFEDSAGEITLSYAEMKAAISGDNRIIKLVELEGTLADLRTEKSGYEFQKGSLQSQRRLESQNIQTDAGIALVAQKNLDDVRELVGKTFEFSTQVRRSDNTSVVQNYAKRDDAVKGLDREVEVQKAEIESRGGSYGGINIVYNGRNGSVVIQKVVGDQKWVLRYTIHADGGRNLVEGREIEGGAGLFASIASLPRSFEKQVEQAKARQEKSRSRLVEIEKQLLEGWPKEAELKAVEAEYDALVKDLLPEEKSPGSGANAGGGDPGNPNRMPVDDFGFLGVLSENKKKLARRLADQLRARSKDVILQSVGLDPEHAALMLRLGVLYAEAGAIRFATWSARMLRSGGGRIRPYLADIYEKVRTHPDSVKFRSKMDAPGVVKATTDTDIAKEIVSLPRVATKPARPDLANPGERGTRLEPGNAEARSMVIGVDERRNAQGLPTPRADSEVDVAAEQRLADPDAKRVLLERARRSAFRDVDVVVADTMIARDGLKALMSGNPQDIADMATLIAARRTALTETARALRQARGRMTRSQSARIALSELLTRLSGGEQRRVMRLMKNLADPDMSGAQKDRIQKMIDAIHENHIQKIVPRILAKLRSFGIMDIDALTDDQLADPRVIGKVARSISTSSSSFGDWFREWGMNAMLSGITSAVANSFSVAYVGWQFTAQRFAELAINSLVRDERSAKIGEVGPMLRAMVPALAKSWRYALASFDSEIPAFDRQFDDSEDIGGTFADAVSGGPKIPGLVGRGVRLPVRINVATDTFVRSWAGMVQVAAVAYRRGVAEGLGGKDLEQFIQEEAGDFQSGSWSEALGWSKRATFQDEAGWVARNLIELREKIPGGWMLLPFVRTPERLFVTGLGRLGAGATLKLLYRAMTQGTGYAKPKAVRDAAESMLGLGMVLAIYALAGGDDDGPYITGSSGSTVRLKGYETAQSQLSARAYPPMSFRVPGSKTWISYGRIDPFAIAIASIVDSYQSVSRAEKGSPIEEEVSNAWRQGVRLVTTRSYLAGVADIMNVIETGGNGLIRMASNIATIPVPNIAKQGMRFSDEKQRESRDFRRPGETLTDQLGRNMAYAAAPLAGVAESLGIEQQVDLWGRTVNKAEILSGPATDWIYRMVVPVGIATPSRPVLDVDRAILNWNAENPTKPFYIEEPDPAISSRSKAGFTSRQTMTGSQYMEYQRRAGTLALGIIDQYNFDPTAPKEEDLIIFRRAIERARKVAKAELFGEDE